MSLFEILQPPQLKGVLQFVYWSPSSHIHVGILMIEIIKSVKQKKERIIEEDG
jgi:hypothetical protein